MTLDQLLVLARIAETGSFRGAAQSLHRAQSAVSYAIKNLEEELGLTLLSREDYRPRLTPAGEAVLVKAKRVLTGMEELQELSLTLNQGDEPFLQVLVSAIVPMSPVIPALKALRQQKPHLLLNLRVEILSVAFKILREEADLGITEIIPQLTNGDLLEKQVLGSVKLFTVCAPDHPLAKAPAGVSPVELQRHVQLIIPSSDQAAKDIKAGIVEGAEKWSVSDFASKRQLLLGGLGWGQMPQSLIQEDLDQGRLVVIRTEAFTELSLPIYLIRRRRKRLGRCQQILWDLLHENWLP